MMFTVNLLLVCVPLVFTIRGTLQLSDDFTGENYDGLNRHVSANRPYSGSRHVSRRVNLTADKIQDYLLSLQSKVLSSNDVLTVKERKVSPLKKDKFFVSVSKPSKSTPDDLQSDQPTNGPQPTDTASSTSIHKAAPTNKSKDTNHWDSVNDFQPFQQDAPKTWNCEFKSNYDCGILNDPSVGDFFHLESRNFFRNFNWQQWYLLLNASEIPGDAVGARLITPYMDTKNSSQGCLSLHYITMASGITRVALYQQDKGNHCIWSTEAREISPPGIPRKHQVDFTVDLFRGSPRFFFELYLDLSKPNAKDTIFALANARLAYRPCLNSHADYCRPQPTREANEHDGSIP